MIIIDDTAEERLERALVKLTPNPGLARCIRFDSAAITAANPDLMKSAQQAMIVNTAREHLAETDMQTFLCADGDVFMLATNLPGKAARLFMESVAVQCSATRVENVAAIYQLSQQMSALRFYVEAKLEKIRAAVAAAEEQSVTQKNKRTREAILNPDVKPQDTENIAARRRQRTAPELMLIEDDSFSSSRLVSNVLQRQFHLTILDDTYMALRTYVRLAPDILFLDIGLPNVTGHELLERILALNPDACVVMLSSSADRVNVMRAMKKAPRASSPNHLPVKRSCSTSNAAPASNGQEKAMKIHDTDAAAYLQSLARALAKDPQSYSAWSCLHLKAPAGQPFTASRIAAASAGQHGHDSAIAITPNRDLLLFSRERDLNIFQSISLQLGSMPDDMVAIYNLFHDYKPVLATLDAMTVGTATSSMITLPEGTFGGTKTALEMSSKASNSGDEAAARNTF